MFHLKIARQRWSRFGIVGAIVTLLASAGAMTSIANAASRTCSQNWYPSSGIYSGRFLPSTSQHTYTEFVLRTTFKFSANALQAYNCFGSSTLEVDMQIRDGAVKDGVKSWESNLPGAYPDTEAYDGKTRVLTVGSTKVKDLKANTEYYAQITVVEFDVDAHVPTATLNLSFQRGHFAQGVVENLYCLKHGGKDPAWCVFPDKNGSAPMLNTLGSSPRVDLTATYPYLDSAIWGSYRRTELRAGGRINSGDRLYSPNGLNTLVMRPDGNLVEYIPGHTEVWSSGTSAPEAIAIAQDDGNLVIVAPGNRPIWSTGTHLPGSVFQLQNDRNFVAYAPGHRSVWSNNIAGR